MNKKILIGIKFLIKTTTIMFIVLIIAWVIGLKGIAFIHSLISSAMLSSQGINVIINYTNGIIIESNKTKALIDFLCLGLIELGIVLGAIISTKEVKKKLRFYGVITGIILWLVLNPLRIAISFTALKELGIKEAILIHDVFFRISLFIIIAVYYFIWLKTSLKISKTS